MLIDLGELCPEEDRFIALLYSMTFCKGVTSFGIV